MLSKGKGMKSTNDRAKYGFTIFKANSVPERWAGNSEMDKSVWSYYTCKIAPGEIAKAIQNQTSFAELYRLLARLRLKVEWVKAQIKNGEASFVNPNRCEVDRQIKALHCCQTKMASVSHLSSVSYGAFDNEVNCEKDIARWGKIPNSLAKARFSGREDLGADHGYIGLSDTKKWRDCYHPKGHVIELLDEKFQEVLKQDNIFDALSIFSDMMYILSNYPPVTRGSAAINRWIFDSVMQNKFGISQSILPNELDWFAFFETREQFKAYFHITTAMSLISQIKPGAINVNEIKRNWEMLLTDPCMPESIELRKSLWSQLQNVMNDLLNDDKVSSEDKTKINMLIKGPLDFPVASEGIQLICDILDSVDPVDEIINSLSQEQREYIKKLLILNLYTGDLFLINMFHKIEGFEQLSADLEFFRIYLESDLLNGLTEQLLKGNITENFRSSFRAITDLTDEEFDEYEKLISNNITRIFQDAWSNSYLNSYKGEVQFDIEDDEFCRELIDAIYLGLIDVREFFEFYENNNEMSHTDSEFTEMLRVLNSKTFQLAAKLGVTVESDKFLILNVGELKTAIVNALMSSLSSDFQSSHKLNANQFFPDLNGESSDIDNSRLSKHAIDILINLANEGINLKGIINHEGRINHDVFIKKFLELESIDSEVFNLDLNTSMDKIENIYNLIIEFQGFNYSNCYRHSFSDFLLYLNKINIPLSTVADLASSKQRVVINYYSYDEAIPDDLLNKKNKL